MLSYDLMKIMKCQLPVKDGQLIALSLEKGIWGEEAFGQVATFKFTQKKLVQFKLKTNTDLCPKATGQGACVGLKDGIFFLSGHFWNITTQAWYFCQLYCSAGFITDTVMLYSEVQK